MAKPDDPKTISDPRQIPPADEFFLESPLYAAYEITAANWKDVLRIEFFQGPLDAYCPHCNRESVFLSVFPLPYVNNGTSLVEPTDIDTLLDSMFTTALPQEESEHWQWNNTRGGMIHIALADYAKLDRVRSIMLECSRNEAHTMHFFIRVLSSKIFKIGQHPSLADLQSAEIRNYRKTLGEDRYREFNRAIGLNAHGVGVGAFVYLRRIFENLIEDAHARAAQVDRWDEPTFAKARMEDKILTLKDLLPDFLVKNRSIYGILSLGLHDLSEEECLKYFAPMRTSIELILDEKIREDERADKVKNAEKDLQRIRDQR